MNLSSRCSRRNSNEKLLFLLVASLVALFLVRWFRLDNDNELRELVATVTDDISASEKFIPCNGLAPNFASASYGVDRWSCSEPIVNVGYEQWSSVRNLKRFERYLTLGTYESQDFTHSGPGRYPLPPLSRFHTLSYAFADFERREGKVVVEVGTSRSFQHGSAPGCNLDDPKWWHPDNPEDWDWGAGHFTHLACTSLSKYLRKGHMFTVDLLEAHIVRSKIMTTECAQYTSYVAKSSLDFFKEYDTRKYGQIDLLYLDTGDMTPVEVTAELHLEEAKYVVERQLVKPGGLILIDDVRNLAPKQYGEPPGDTYGKAKYSIDYFLEHGFSLVKSEYQVILRNTVDDMVAAFHSKPISWTPRLKLFHISFHLGCINEIEFVGSQLNIEVDSLLWDGAGDGNDKYNINHRRAAKYWDLLKERALQADVVLTSDTTPLARIFLQNGYPGKLLIWISNRFDYAHAPPAVQVSEEESERYAGEHPEEFPTREYYNLIRKAALSSKTAIVCYTAFEHIYARTVRNVEVGRQVIRPSGHGYLHSLVVKKDGGGKVPLTVDKSTTFFIPPYHNDERTPTKCATLGIRCYRGRYAGPLDVKGFKGIIHVPYAWSNFALFEMIAQGTPYFIPSKKLLLAEEEIFWSPPFDKENLDASEWYDPTLAHVFIYFDSWEALPDVIERTDFGKQIQVLQEFSEKHKREVVERWKTVLMKL
ncbi:uncharacterized protein MICPUCDRAFT_54898 [Micromonas pusilla CCMP1545]|uniref:Predicted protein n=1 Tax=Micromonas pusilla (strain CCMP1545) TaxID=564608 RepID=C1NAG7_MICPC|nr:uncharacterized protein MICPUCDRAFT_54898 [Micromonas pusilla CCMP1545]EEH50937.1 predicted protein [Micromonas pusilla CCMP1545]|eukprot:XP_003064957.1 predicted protein [Micromonas pusilla CCMP1545]